MTEENNLYRKIVSVAVEPDTIDNYGCLYVVCDDGTLWYLKTGRDEWGKIQGPALDKPKDKGGND